MSNSSSLDQANSKPKSKRTRLTCPQCGSLKMARSQLERYDALKVTLSGKQPYRCMQCYHRTWFNKASVKGRSISMLIVMLALLVMMVSVYTFFVEEPAIPSVSVIAPNKPAEAEEGTQSGDQSAPSLASLINMPQQSPSIEADADTQPSRIDYVDRQVEQLSPEQQAALLLQAKNQSEAAEQLSQARVAQLESVLLPVDDELESLVKVEVGYIVERWREAWATGNIDDYLSNYGVNFIPAGNVSLTSWKQQRRSRVNPQKRIQLSLSEFDISMSDNLDQGTVYFNQRYQSGSYVESSRKRLMLEKEAGTWKIVRELELEE